MLKGRVTKRILRVTKPGNGVDERRQAEKRMAG
jgi:hypothetical protein